LSVFQHRVPKTAGRSRSPGPGPARVFHEDADMQLEAEEQEMLLDVLRESITNLRKDILSAVDSEIKQGLRKKEEVLKALVQKIDPERAPAPRADIP